MKARSVWGCNFLLVHLYLLELFLQCAPLKLGSEINSLFTCRKGTRYNGLPSKSIGCKIIIRQCCSDAVLL